MSMIFSGKAKEHYSQLNYWELPEADKLLTATLTGLYTGDEMAEKLILPTEIKVCATCSYWDGEREVDNDMNVVVVADDVKGECLVTESSKSCLHHMSSDHNCLWEDVTPDTPTEETNKD